LCVSEGQLTHGVEKARVSLSSGERSLRIWSRVLHGQVVIDGERCGRALGQMRYRAIVGNPEDEGSLGRVPSKNRGSARQMANTISWSKSSRSLASLT